jgi:hypothetical protein
MREMIQGLTPTARRGTWLELAVCWRPAGWLVALLLALPALWPLLRPGFFVSDDGRFHVYRIAALAQAWEQGVLHPRLFPDFGFGYGQAVLNFYAPLSYWPGAVMATLGVSPAAAAEATIALGFLLAALAAYGYGRSLWSPAAGILSAVAFTYYPYHLADAYQRGALPEHFAFLWLPLILWAATALFRAQDYRPALLCSALAWAGLVLTHNLTALLMAPATAAYLLLMALWTRRWQRLWPAAGGLALALALTAGYWLPVLFESRAVGLALGPSDGYKEHLLPLGRLVASPLLYTYQQELDGSARHALSWLAVVLSLGVALLLAWRLAVRRRPAGWPVAAFGVTLACASAGMLTTSALPIWQPLTPILGTLQYPWRFQILTATGILVCAGALPALLPQTWRGPSAVLVAVACLWVSLPGIPAQPLAIPAAEAWSPERMWREDAETGQVGATWTGEFLPLAVQEQRWALGRSRQGAVDGPVPASRPAVRLERLGYAQAELSFTGEVPRSVSLHQFQLPGWQAWLDGQSAPTSPSGEMALVTVDVPPGTRRLAFRFGTTPARLAGAAAAALAALLWAALAWRWRGSGRQLPLTAAALLGCVLLLSANGLGMGQRSWSPRPVQVAVGDIALLLGYDVELARGQDALDVTLYWFALRDVGVDLKAFVHLLDSNGQVMAQHDGDPGGGFTPTTRWRAGELVVDRHRLPLAGDLRAGQHQLKAGLYLPESMRNLPVNPPAADGRADLGVVQLPRGGQ